MKRKKNRVMRRQRKRKMKSKRKTSREKKRSRTRSQRKLRKKLKKQRKKPYRQGVRECTPPPVPNDWPGSLGSILKISQAPVRTGWLPGMMYKKQTDKLSERRPLRLDWNFHCIVNG